MSDILCNGLRFEKTLKFSIKNTLNSPKKGKYYHRRQKTTFFFQVLIIKLTNWIPFKLARLLVMHESGKLTRVGELSVAERLQGRQGNPLARLTQPAL